MICTFNKYHLGDQLIHLNWLRKVAIQNPNTLFVHYCDEQYIHTLTDMIADMDNIQVMPLSYTPAGAIDSWINAHGLHDTPGYRVNKVALLLKHFQLLAQSMGIQNPATTRTDLLLDYPALTQPSPLSNPFDVLIINSQPRSGQFQSFNPYQFKALVQYLIDQGKTVTTTEPTLIAPATRDYNLNIHQIGSISLFCNTIIAVDTAPLWPTLNPYNLQSVHTRIILCDLHEFPFTDNTLTTNNISNIKHILQIP